MAYKAHITGAQRETIQAENREVIAVSFDIIDEETKEVAVSYRRAFDLDATKEAIEAELSKAAATYESDKAVGEAAAKVEADTSKADETIEALLETNQE